MTKVKQHKLVELSIDRLKGDHSIGMKFTENVEVNNFLNDLDNFPHAFVLACLMDRQITAERAWQIPFVICNKLNAFTLSELAVFSLADFEMLFTQNNLHRFNTQMANVFFEGIKRINEVYNGDASNIWKGNPSSATVVYRFLEFQGCGVKISTMAANILTRQFHISFSDRYSIDVSPDVHIIRVMKRLWGFDAKTSNEILIYKSRELNPEFPGIIDFSTWEIGRKWCRPKNPNCGECPIQIDCINFKNNKNGHL